MIRREVDSFIEENRPTFEHMSDQIWAFAETSFQEHRSSKLQSDYLAKQGFRITCPVAGLDTAFIAEWGEGRPVIAVLGEYDALPAQSQEADALERKPLTEGAPGHACGHNLLGTAGVEAVCAVKRYLQERELPGTIRYYGCPAEEGGSGKVYMILAGAFRDVDCSLTWHPGVSYGINKKTLAIIHANFRFKGVASHAYAAPWQGRSALDAAELMNVGVQYLREHVKPDTYFHYAMLDSGGTAANIVPATAEVGYIMRCSDAEYLLEVYDRIHNIAKGAALMTGTTLEAPRITSASSTLIQNRTLNQLTADNMSAYFPVTYTEEELAYAEKYKQCYSMRNADFPMDQVLIDGTKFTCTDAADVSWVTPLVMFKASTLALGTPGHSWGTTAQGKSLIAYRGMHTAAKILAQTALDLLEEPQLAERARKDFEQQLAGRKYRTQMEGLTPPSRKG